ncbi:aspartate aminotransferase family protein [Rhodobacteraceae bacterium RKSG542]|uniref:aspartate aminotransferase family protein n=1 Tax=Pseudovibrio flavus TaxID=2529854 RepID=UPI0012BBAB5D|nr:aspartate aminotransferase family protein [Pseudovibrio flavus]MTI18072.1 aspartate aminotransferase family protein [Pseudovibrio flavus]
MNHIANNLPTAVLQAKDAAHHLHPFTDTKALNEKGTRIIARADGVYLWDTDGNKILDGMAGLWCVNVGYGRKEIIDAAHRQMQELPYYNTFFQTSHPPAIALAEKLSKLAPEHLNHVFFVGSGSEANDTVVRMVRHYWASMGEPSKKIIISRKNGYHGSTMAGASLGGMTAMHAQGGLPIPDINHIDQPYWYGEGGDMSPAEFGIQRAQALEDEIKRVGAENVAAFIAEPIQGAGGVVIPPHTYWPEIQRICKQYNILLVVDEVICGFGRTGNWFGSQTFDIKPDLMPIAKGLSSGYLPIGAVLVSDRVAEGFIENGGDFNHGYTYSAHPVACAAALANLEILENEGIIEKVANETGPYLAEKWMMLADHPLVGEARICGLVGALELSPNKETRAPFAAETGTVGTICRDFCFETGLVMRHVRDSMIISPPLVITKEEIDELVAKAHKALDLTLEAVKAKGLI